MLATAMLSATTAAADPAAPELQFSTGSVPTGFGGLALGGPLPADTVHGTFAGADTTASAASDDGATVSQITIRIDLQGVDGVGTALVKRLGPEKHATWRGPASWLFDVQPPFDYSGTPSLTLVIVPPNERHVCGRADGFAAFYAALQRQVRAHDWPAVAREMVFPQLDWADAEGSDESVQLSTPADLLVHPAEVFRMALRGGTITCDLANRVYVVTYGGARLSPALYIARGATGAWQITNVGHAPHDLF